MCKVTYLNLILLYTGQVAKEAGQVLTLVGTGATIHHRPVVSSGHKRVTHPEDDRCALRAGREVPQMDWQPDSAIGGTSWHFVWCLLRRNPRSPHGK